MSDLKAATVPPMTIYALCDPDTGKVRYIGQTKDAWKRYGAYLTRQRGLDDSGRLYPIDAGGRIYLDLEALDRQLSALEEEDAHEAEGGEAIE
jgi:hypothetical protein